jgi:F420-dependent oxidoreductase-like protein
MRLRVLLESRYGATWEQLLQYALATEEAGFDAFFRSDHFLSIESETALRPTDSWTTLAGLALTTSRVTLGTLMTAATFRYPGQLATEVATVDAMSGGRVELGIGTAWMESEHRYFGIPFPSLGDRFDRLEEQLVIITGLWTTPVGERFSFAGQHYQLDECPAFPLTGHERPGMAGVRPRPRIIIGGGGARRTPTLAARFADEYNTGFSTETWPERRAYVRRLAAENGRDPATIRLSVTLPVFCGATRAEAQRRAEFVGEPGAMLVNRGVTGTPRDVLDRLGQLAQAGFDTVYVHLFDAADTDHIRLLGQEVVPRARGFIPG